jgi:hypothetical protein|tara:strand:+ start:178 stop:486 length:309 start_codon:yes stop_codon:yes gene_type:complete
MDNPEEVPGEVMSAVKKLASSMAAHKMTGSVELKPSKRSHHEGRGEKKEQSYEKLYNDIRGLKDSWDDHDHQYYKDLKELLDDRQNVRHEEEDYDEDHGEEY